MNQVTQSRNESFLILLTGKSILRNSKMHATPMPWHKPALGAKQYTHTRERERERRKGERESSRKREREQDNVIFLSLVEIVSQMKNIKYVFLL